MLTWAVVDPTELATFLYYLVTDGVRPPAHLVVPRLQLVGQVVNLPRRVLSIGQQAG